MIRRSDRTNYLPNIMMENFMQKIASESDTRFQNELKKKPEFIDLVAD